MSRIGNKPIPLNSKVKIEVKERNITVSGSKGSLEYTLPDSIGVKIEDNLVKVSVVKTGQNSKPLHGLARSLLANMIQGVDVGFQKQLEMQGVGYRAQLKGKTLVLNLGYSHPIEYPIPSDVELSLKDNTILVKGADKQRVGQVAAIIRQFRKPEPYKGKGIRYSGEVIVLKEGKTV